MNYETILYEVEGTVGILTLNRPEMVNAMNIKMIEELTDFWQKRQKDEEVRVIIFRGAGDRGFCSGIDLKEVKERYTGEKPEPVTVTVSLDSLSNISLIYRLMRTAPQPIIAAVHGAVVGGGLSFAYTSDIRLASEDAKFRAQYINLGTGGAEMGSSFYLWRLVGLSKATEMSLLGESMTAQEALRLGLVNYLYSSKDDLFPAAMTMANKMAAKGRMQLQLTKEVLNMALNGINYEDAIRIENRNQTILSQVANIQEMVVLKK